MKTPSLLLASVLLLGVACGDEVSSEEEAALAYVGLDQAVGRALRLGMDGFNAASSANIPVQTGSGDVSGTMTVSGQVDQGASANKGLRLLVALESYADVVDVDDDDEVEVAITYDTDPEALPALELSLRDIPTGTFTGTLVGTFLMSEDLEGEVTLNLTLAGDLEEDPDNAGQVRRVAGSTTVTGTATSGGGGVYDVNVTL